MYLRRRAFTVVHGNDGGESTDTYTTVILSVQMFKAIGFMQTNVMKRPARISSCPPAMAVI